MQKQDKVQQKKKLTLTDIALTAKVLETFKQSIVQHFAHSTRNGRKRKTLHALP